MQYGKEWLNIANAALSMVSSHLMQKMQDGSMEASYVETLLPVAVEDVYSTVDFYDLADTEEVPRLDEKHPLYAYRYARPVNAAKILKVTTIPENTQWELSEGCICTDACSVIVKYVKLPETPEDMPPYARTLVTFRLASLLASPIAHDDNLAATLKSEYQNQLSTTISLTVAERYQEDRSTSFWTDTDAEDF